MSAPFFGNCLTGLPKISQWIFSVDDGSGVCTDLTNAVNWLNNDQSAPPWNVEYDGTFNTPASIAPDSESTSTANSDGTVDFYSSWNANYPTLIKTAVLCADPTLYCVAYWTDEAGSYGPQATCILSGIPAVCGVSGPAFAYNLPLPALAGCNSSTNPAILYQLWDDAGWATQISESAIPSDLQDPGNCNPLPNDPFDDEDP